MQVFIGADHRGYQLKTLLYKWLRAHGHDAVDCGPAALVPDDDYPDYAAKVAKEVAAHAGSRGVVVCGSGVGVEVVANKVRGVRAASALSADTVAHGRARDDMNVLALSADTLDARSAEALVELFLMTPFGAEPRDVRRQEKIAALESENFKG